MKKPATPSSDELIRIRVKIIPSASRNAITGFHADELVVKIAAPPEKGKANACLAAFLAKQVGVRKNAVTITSGQTSPVKRIAIAGITAATLQERLGLDEQRAVPT